MEAAKGRLTRKSERSSQLPHPPFSILTIRLNKFEVDSLNPTEEDDEQFERIFTSETSAVLCFGESSITSDFQFSSTIAPQRPLLMELIATYHIDHIDHHMIKLFKIDCHNKNNLASSQMR